VRYALDDRGRKKRDSRPDLRCARGVCQAALGRGQCGRCQDVGYPTARIGAFFDDIALLHAAVPEMDEKLQFDVRLWCAPGAMRSIFGRVQGGYAAWSPALLNSSLQVGLDPAALGDSVDSEAI